MFSTLYCIQLGKNQGYFYFNNINLSEYVNTNATKDILKF